MKLHPSTHEMIVELERNGFELSSAQVTEVEKCNRYAELAKERNTAYIMQFNPANAEIEYHETQKITISR